MRIVIISDSHDNIWKLEKIMTHLSTAGAILHCGDIISPFMIKRMIYGTEGIPIHFVWGNNDGDKKVLSEVAAESEYVRIHGDFAEIVIDGLKIALTHYPQIAQALAESDSYDLVCYGHDHTASLKQVGKTVLLNPGELMGMNSTSTIAAFDTESKEVVFIEII